MSRTIKVPVPQEFEYQKVVAVNGQGIGKKGMVVLAHEDVPDDPEEAADEIFDFLTKVIPSVTYDLLIGRLRRYELDTKKRGGV